MNDIENILNFLPAIKKMDLDKVASHSVYIGVAGFEDRALAILDEAVWLKKKFDYVIAIEYKPFDKRNRKDEFQKKLNQLNILDKNVKWITYDRFEPEGFLVEFEIINKISSHASNIIVDVSAMSKLLIIVLLQGLRNYKDKLSIIYAEAATYHPTKEEFKAQTVRYEKETETLPIFLTTDVFNIITTTSLSTISMQGFPLLMIAFPTFNYRELIALISEITPQHLILLEGRPHEPHNYWRLDAIRWLNRRILEEHISIDEILTEQERIISTFNYKETINILEKIYQKYKYTRRIVIVPTGSKLQTVGMFLFKQMHPDIQIIYPVTKKFADEYTKKYKVLWEISFANLSEYMTELDEYRKEGLAKLRQAIQSAQK